VTSAPNAAQELRLATEAVLEAGAEVRARFGAVAEVRYKSPEQPVTEADLRADELLRARLLGARPDYGWLSEETADSAERLSRCRVWVVDPIDGTNSFVAGIPEFVVSVGLVHEGIPLAAAVYNPITDELYQATRGGGATRNGVPISVAGRTGRAGEPVLLASRWEIDAGVLEVYRPRWSVVALGSTAYRMVKVAEGAGHAFVSPATKNEWDVCGAALVVSEAGGRVTRGDGSDLRFNRPSPVLEGIMAWSPDFDVPTPAVWNRNPGRTT
jgi:myo-inositol-1(or 4)-monophosphatase